MPMIELDITGRVRCDHCNRDYSDDRETKGGVLFQSKAYCPQPECAPRLLKDAKIYGELAFVRAVAAPEETFFDFVMRVRNGNNAIRVSSGDPKQVEDFANRIAENMGVKI